MAKLKEKQKKKVAKKDIKKSNKKNVKANKIKQHITQVVTLSVIIFAVIFCAYKIIKLAIKPTDSFLIEQGKVEQAESVIGYVIRDEKVIQMPDESKKMIQIKNEGERVSVGEEVFRYEATNEEELNSKIKDLNNQIQTAMEGQVELPSSDIKALEKQIESKINGIKDKNNLQDIKEYKSDINGYITKMVNEKYPTNNLAKTKYVNDSKITDHYAIIPTGQGFENYAKLPDLHKEVYRVIVKRFLAIFYPPAEFNKINVTINIENETFYATEKVCIKTGYLEVLKQKENNQEANENLKDLKKGQELEVKEITTKEAETTPPTRYNSGSLILAMENAGKLIEDEALREQIKGAGIGTSATRGEIIKKLEKIKHIEINPKTQIVTPTVKGEAIYDVVEKSMPDMLNPKLTASWEKGLDMVAKKEINPEEFMQKLEKYIKSKFEKFIYR